MSSDEEAMDLKGQCVDLLFECPQNREAATCSAGPETWPEVSKEGKTAAKTPMTHRRLLATERCPFRMVRELDVVERVKWLKSLGMDELRGLVAYHEKCNRDGRPVNKGERHGKRTLIPQSNPSILLRRNGTT